MFKRFIIFLLSILFTFNIQAQNFGGGVTLGLSTSQVGGDNLSGFKKVGALVGIFANRNISDLLSFQMEMNYIQKGSKNPNMNDIEHRDYERPNISSSYIEVPLLLQYNQSNNLQIEAGGQIGYLINSYYHNSYGEMPSEINPFINYDIGLLLGVNYKYSKNISLNTRISSSILPLGNEDYNNNNTYNSSTKGKYNLVLSYALHYNF